MSVFWSWVGNTVEKGRASHLSRDTSTQTDWIPLRPLIPMSMLDALGNVSERLSMVSKSWVVHVGSFRACSYCTGRVGSLLLSHLPRSSKIAMKPVCASACVSQQMLHTHSFMPGVFSCRWFFYGPSIYIYHKMQDRVEMNRDNLIKWTSQNLIQKHNVVNLTISHPQNHHKWV